MTTSVNASVNTPANTSVNAPVNTSVNAPVNAPVTTSGNTSVNTRPYPLFVGAAASGRRTYYAGATADATGVAVVFLALVLRIISTCRKHVVSFGHTFLTCRKHVVGFGHANLPKS